MGVTVAVIGALRIGSRPPYFAIAGSAAVCGWSVEAGNVWPDHSYPHIAL
jgi:hypothetical protein